MPLIMQSLSHGQHFVIPWAIQSMDFSRVEYWSGLPFPSPGHLPNPGVQPRSPTLQADSLPAEPNIATIKLRKYSKILTAVNAE